MGEAEEEAVGDEVAGEVALEDSGLLMVSWDTTISPRSAARAKIVESSALPSPAS